jgi:5-dehydro-2-deoxygluconokinase
MQNIGYAKPLFILAFDHRASLIKKLFGTEEPSAEQKDQFSDFKYVIYQGFEKGVDLGIPKDNAALLVEEEFGDKILCDAKAKGYQFILTAEKSGAEEFDFQYGEDFPAHIEKYQPTFTKALVRYNPEGDREINARQAGKLKILSDYSHGHNYKFLIEPIVPATEAQLASVSGDKKRYDEEVRPRLAVEMIKQLQDAGVEPDIWKIEGLNEPAHYQAVISQAKCGGRDQVSAVVLGRGESAESVENWLKAGAKVEGVLGFAIGRTIFWDAIMNLKEGKITREEAIGKIGENYLHFYNIYKSNK